MGRVFILYLYTCIFFLLPKHQVQADIAGRKYPVKTKQHTFTVIREWLEHRNPWLVVSKLLFMRQFCLHSPLYGNCFLRQDPRWVMGIRQPQVRQNRVMVFCVHPPATASMYSLYPKAAQFLAAYNNRPPVIRAHKNQMAVFCSWAYILCS